MPVIGGIPDVIPKTVIYATDFSLCSRSAGFFAARIASWFSAKLLVTHAFTRSQAAMEVEIGDRHISQQRLDLTRLLSGEAEILRTNSLQAIPTLLEGDPIEVIPILADTQQPSMIVLGTHGAGRLERGMIGSVAESILRSTDWPALTVGPRVRPLASNGNPFKRVLFAADVECAAATAVYAISLSKAFGAEIEVLNVIPDDAIEDRDRTLQLQATSFDALENLVPQKARELSHVRTFVAVGAAHSRILEHVREQSIDLLVLGIRRTTHLSLETRTSGAFRIIVDAGCPVLTVRG